MPTLLVCNPFSSHTHEFFVVVGCLIFKSNPMKLMGKKSSLIFCLRHWVNFHFSRMTGYFFHPSLIAHIKNIDWMIFFLLLRNFLAFFDHTPHFYCLQSYLSHHSIFFYRSYFSLNVRGLGRADRAIWWRVKREEASKVTENDEIWTFYEMCYEEGRKYHIHFHNL